MKNIVRKKFKFKKWVYYLMFILFLFLFVFSTYKIIKWAVDTHNSKVILDDITNTTNIIESTDEGTLINPPVNLNDDYWDFIKIPFVSVNFNDLLTKNSDTVAWINVNNTNINYPVVQTTNNDYYLSKAFDKTYNVAGWIFMDYRNDAVSFNTNTIIYGHSMKNKSMFGSLLKVKTNEWYTDKTNQVIKLSTPTKNTLWRIFSIYLIDAEDYYITTSFKSNDSIQEFFNTIKSRSTHNFNVDLNYTDKILTLSTCNSATTSERLVVHAKLISEQTR